jgi:transcriptional regulator with XRE-family HTH domain
MRELASPQDRVKPIQYWDIDLGRRIQYLNYRTGLSQIQVARRIGVSESIVSRWINGSRKPCRKNLNRLARVLGVGLGELQKLAREP